MPTISDCPRVDALERLLLGQVTLDETDALEAHLFSCPHCAQVLQRLNGVDPLVDAMRDVQTQPAPFVSEAAAALIPWLKRLRPRDLTQTLSLVDPAGQTPVSSS